MENSRISKDASAASVKNKVKISGLHYKSDSNKEPLFTPVSLVGLTAMGSASSVFPERVTQAT